MTITTGPAVPAAVPSAARLRPQDLAGLASVGLRTRKLRAALSALGIAIGVAAIVAVLGLSQSSAAGLNAEIARLGTNLLTVTNGQTFGGQTAELPDAAPGMVGRWPGVTAVQYTGTVSADVYRSPLIPSIDTDGLGVQAASLNLPAVVGTSIAQGSYLNAATAKEPVAVLGAETAQLPGHRPDLARPADPGRRPVVLRHRHPQPRHLRPRARHLRPGRLPRSAEIPRLRRAPLRDLPPGQEQPGHHRRQPARRPGQPAEPQRGRRLPAFQRPHRASRRH